MLQVSSDSEESRANHLSISCSPRADAGIAWVKIQCKSTVQVGQFWMQNNTGALNFREPMFLWGVISAAFPEGIPPEMHDFEVMEGFELIEGFQLIKPLEVREFDAGKGIFVRLEMEAALRSYIVYDHKPWGGGIVLGGGRWITIDLPSFVDEFAKAQQSCPWHARLLGRCRSPRR